MAINLVLSPNYVCQLATVERIYILICSCYVAFASRVSLNSLPALCAVRGGDVTIVLFIDHNLSTCCASSLSMHNPTKYRLSQSNVFNAFLYTWASIPCNIHGLQFQVHEYTKTRKAVFDPNKMTISLLKTAFVMAPALAKVVHKLA